jgi:hypothetical protein
MIVFAPVTGNDMASAERFAKDVFSCAAAPYPSPDRRCCHRNASILDQSHRLKLELAAQLPSSHSNSPARQTPYLGVHESGSRPDNAAFLGFLGGLVRHGRFRSP